jgi:hypothetical protein
VLALPLEAGVPADVPAEEAAEGPGDLDLDVKPVSTLSTNAFETNLRSGFPEGFLQSAAGHLQAGVGDGLLVGLEIEATWVEVIAIATSKIGHRVEKSLRAPEPE